MKRKPFFNNKNPFDVMLWVFIWTFVGFIAALLWPR